MTKEERIERLEKELAELKEEIAADKMKKGPWKPENGESYYTVSNIGYAESLCWLDDNIDKRKLEIGSVFRTMEEIERAFHRLKARKKFLDAGGHEGMNGYLFGDRYHAYPQRYDNMLIVAKEGSVTAFDIWFETESDAQKAIDSLTEDEVKALCWMGESE